MFFHIFYYNKNKKYIITSMVLLSSILNVGFHILIIFSFKNPTSILHDAFLGLFFALKYFFTRKTKVFIPKKCGEYFVISFNKKIHNN